ncbi:hypothetical protein N7510_008628 [Penicillium lagena]|uniref:uncharacterized protein n=1 Tax=Penicillium lagena TaxID=94218 RepID=UPI0025425531|nr:uncharacterized protein N7510_008628 [Penicillium lagena]KAJ5605847.1 hypothetical protein N7510_008628 [Penicillium lagena]
MDDDDEYEYEYHDFDTETFYLNLDLTSHHGPLRAPRRRQPASSSNDAPLPDESNPTNANNDLTPLDSAETEPLPTEQIQILGLHTSNPIVSYHNQVFTCAWADQIGTELVFSHPDPDADHHTAPLRTGESFELLAANSVKILGRKANLTSSSGVAGEQNLESNLSASESTPRLLPRRGAAPTNQTQFLERLQNIKAARGETDTVRTIMSTRRNMNLGERLKGWARTEEQVAEIQRLNEKANGGDLDATAALENLWMQLQINQPEPEAAEESAS